MTEKDTVIVFDCGATNVRAVAITLHGEILASESFTNNTRPDPFYPSYRIWDVHEIWKKMCDASTKVISQIGTDRIAGVTVTTFGVDGTLFDRSGKMLYPVISWQCERTIPVLENIGKYVPVEELYSECGVLPYSFNTINKLIWFSENKSELIAKSHRFLFLPSIFALFLTGKMVNDITMAGTSMLADLRERKFSKKILKAINFPEEILGYLAEPGTITGLVTTKASAETLLPAGAPVVATGHDTQFAIFGSGAGRNEPVLSSGTWEILMVRAEGFSAGLNELHAGITTELDPAPGMFNIGKQWIASGMLEWCRKSFYSDVKENAYEIMIAGAEKVPPGCNGIKIKPGFNEETKGRIEGLTMESTRDEIYRAMLEALS